MQRINIYSLYKSGTAWQIQNLNAVNLVDTLKFTYFYSRYYLSYISNVG